MIIRWKLIHVKIRKHLDYVLSGIFPAEAVDSNQGHFSPITNSITTLLTTLTTFWASKMILMGYYSIYNNSWYFFQ